MQFEGGVLSACLTLSGVDAVGCKSVWEGADDAEDEAADAPTSLVLSFLLGEHAVSMIAVINKKSDDVSFFILLFSVLKRPSENLPFHFSDDLLLVQLKNLVIANKVLNLS